MSLGNYELLVKDWKDINEKPEEFGAEYKAMLAKGYESVFPQFEDGTELPDKCPCCDKKIYYFKKL